MGEVLFCCDSTIARGDFCYQIQTIVGYNVLGGSALPTLFLSHTSIDKPFVEKLVADLKPLGVDSWVDKYEIKVGESIFWKVEEGLDDSEFFGIVLSPEALKSDWVQAEISAAWGKKMLSGNSSILPILYRPCRLPALLKSLKYADFTQDYNTGFADLARVFGIENVEAITGDT